jgi:hypothetical protein
MLEIKDLRALPIRRETMARGLDKKTLANPVQRHK